MARMSLEERRARRLLRPRQVKRQVKEPKAQVGVQAPPEGYGGYGKKGTTPQDEMPADCPFRAPLFVDGTPPVPSKSLEKKNGSCGWTINATPNKDIKYDASDWYKPGALTPVQLREKLANQTEVPDYVPF